jgi:RNase P/RNase MRP subunit p29
VNLVDTAAPAGALQYTVVARDGNGNTATSAVLAVQKAAALPSGQIAIIAPVSGKAVGVSGTASATVQQTITDSPSQRWTVIPKAEGRFQLKNAATGACLAVSGQSQADSTPVLQWACADQPHFLWSLKDAGNGYSQLVASHSGKCLTLRAGNTADGTPFVQYDCAAQPATSSQFTLRAAGQATIVARGSGKAVGVSGTAAQTVQQTISGASSQRWTMVPRADGRFQLKNAATGACLAVSGQSQADAAKVLQWTCANEPHFLWSLKDAGSGYSQLLASHSGKCLFVAGGSNADGAEFIQNTCTTAPTTASQFTLRMSK